MDSERQLRPGRYRAFISYSSHDERWAAWLQRALETYRVPSRLVGTLTKFGPVPARLAPIFRDRSDLASATDLGSHIEEALGESDNLIVVCSPHAVASRWVNEEIETFQRQGHGRRIHCLIVAGEPSASETPGREAEECFPPALRHAPAGGSLMQHIEPIGADVRPERDGRTNARLKIIAGLLGLEFDALKQREQRRRMRRLAAVAILATVVMAITSGLAVEAVLARRTAERRQRQAEELVDFMLGDLNDRLRQVERLDILEAVDNHAVTYFLSLPTSDVTDTVLARRATALEKIGSVRADQGRLSAALESYQAAAAINAQLLERAPQDPSREAAYAGSLIWIGNAHWFQGHIDEARRAFDEATGLYERASAARPADAELLSALAGARTNSGRVQEVRGDFAAARNLYATVEATYSALAGRDPANVRWQQELAEARGNIGKLALEQGEIGRAIDSYAEVMKIKADIARRDPRDRDAQESLLISEAILGRTLGLCGALEPAAAHLNQAVGSARRLLDFDGVQTAWREDYAIYSRNLGQVERLRGRLDAAGARDADAMRVLAELVGIDRTNAVWRRELALAEDEMALVRLARGDAAEAEVVAESGLESIADTHAASPDDRTLRFAAAESLVTRGKVAAARQLPDAARGFWQRAREILDSDIKVNQDPLYVATWVQAAVLLDDVEAVRPALKTLARSGYRAADFEAILRSKKIAYAGVESLPQCLDPRPVAGDTHGRT